MEAKLMITTFASEAEGSKVVAALLEQRLIGCGTLLPKAISVYRWQGEVKTESECLALLKTTASKLEAAKSALLTLHPYEVPELLVVSPSDVNASYLDWLIKSCEDEPV